MYDSIHQYYALCSAIPCETRMAMANVMSISHVCFLRIGKGRRDIFNKACQRFGLIVVETGSKCDLILIDDEVDIHAPGKVSTDAVFVRTQWLSDSIKQGHLLAHQPYINTTPCPSKRSTDGSRSSSILPLKRERSSSSSLSDTDDESSTKRKVR
jgi:hypothetical protein